MKLEVIKSYTLSILVGISLILSYSLWSYQPNDDYLEEDDFLNAEQIDLGGSVENKKSLVQPSMMVFSKYNNNYGFSNPNQMLNLYEDMQSWVLYNYRTNEGNGRPRENQQIEIIYPVKLSMDMISSLFTINNVDEINLPANIYFQRFYITFKDDNSLSLIFLSTDGKTQVKFDVNNTLKFDLLNNYITSLEGLEEYVVLEDQEEFPIYLPMEPVVPKYNFNVPKVSKLRPDILKNALFPNPLEVVVNVSSDNEVWYQYGQRTMQVYENQLNMEYVIPQETGYIYDPVTITELLDVSIAKINGYKGWAGDYQLESYNTSRHFIRYQMYHRGYPVFHFEGLSTIEQLWVDNELIEHRQPLFKINNPIPEAYNLTPGREVVKHLKNNSNYDIEEIEDIRIGYRLSYQDISEENISFSLTPAWFIKINGAWSQIYFDDELQRKGVS